MSFQSEVIFSAIFFAIGTTISDIGRATTKLMANPLIHFSKKSGTKPEFTMVRNKEIVKDMANDISAPNKIVEYLLLIFTVFTV